MILQCVKCNFKIEIPLHDKICPICFSDYLDNINKIQDNEKRYDELTIFINELISFEHLRTKHNLSCEHKIDFDGNYDLDNWIEINKNPITLEKEMIEYLNKNIKRVD